LNILFWRYLQTSIKKVDNSFFLVDVQNIARNEENIKIKSRILFCAVVVID
jgi:hypothetical protein